jgi:hypothetical protein
VRPQLQRELDSFGAVAGLADDFHIGFLIQDQLETLPYYGMVVS